VSERSTLSADYQRDWPTYFAAVASQPPRDTCLRALANIARDHAAQMADRPRGGDALLVAIDLACGEGRDTRAILRQGLPGGMPSTPRTDAGAPSPLWRVLAIDAHEQAVQQCMDKADLDALDRVAVSQMRLEEVPEKLADFARPRRSPGDAHGHPQPPTGSVHLINASFALPFCTPEAFPALWAWIIGSLAPSHTGIAGRFAGQLFGDRDEWAPIRPASHFTRAQVEALLAPLTIEHLEEVEKDGDDATGKRKHHHVYHIVARSRG
jgi:tellurite methyltransferase